MKKIILLLPLFVLMACSSGEDGFTPAAPSGKVGGEDVPPAMSKQWGELSCQVNLSCSNMVLNKAYSNLELFLLNNFGFAKDMSSLKGEPSFGCGQSFMKEWAHYFPQSTGYTKKDVQDLSQFAIEVLSLSKCKLKRDYITKISTYFVNTKEYKNEN